MKNKKYFKARKVYSTVALNKGALYFQEYTEVTSMSLLISTEILNRGAGRRIRQACSVLRDCPRGGKP